MTSAPVRDPLADHLLTPQNAAFLFIDYQPSQLATIRSMDAALLMKNAVSTVRTIKTYGVPVVHSTVNVANGQGPTLPELADLLTDDKPLDRTTADFGPQGADDELPPAGGADGLEEFDVLPGVARGRRHVVPGARGQLYLRGDCPWPHPAAVHP
jgi:nicotinamidase-related amidase